MTARTLVVVGELTVGLLLICVAIGLYTGVRKRSRAFVVLSGGASFLLFAGLTLAGVDLQRRTPDDTIGLWLAAVLFFYLAATQYRKNPRTKTWRLSLLAGFGFVVIALIGV